MVISPLPSADFQAESIGGLLIGTPYRALDILGSGGMGQVYLIEHSFLGRRFALKVLHERFTTDPGLVDRMRVEAQATSRLQHPNIVDVSDFWIASDGRPCMVMELLEGTTVAHELMVHGQFPVDQSIAYARQMLSALSAAHALGLVHRDIKPENLFLHMTKTRPAILKILDFGVTRILPNAPNTAPLPPARPTTAGIVVGTPRFASPEGLRGEKVDSRADVFSAGLVLYAMLTRRGAYDGMSSTNDPVTYPVPPPSKYIDSSTPPNLDSVVLKSIKWNINERYQKVVEFEDALKSV